MASVSDFCRSKGSKRAVAVSHAHKLWDEATQHHRCTTPQTLTVGKGKRKSFVIHRCGAQGRN